MKLNEYQKNLRNLVETEIRKKKSKSIYFKEPSFKDKHLDAIKRFSNRYGLSKDPNESPIDYITRTGKLEEYYQIVLVMNGNLKINPYLKQKNTTKKLELAAEKKKKEEKELLLKEASLKKYDLLVLNMKNFSDKYNKVYRQTHNIPEDQEIFRNDFNWEILDDVSKTINIYFHFFNNSFHGIGVVFSLIDYLQVYVLSNTPHYNSLQESEKIDIIISTLNDLTSRKINFT